MPAALPGLRLAAHAAGHGLAPHGFFSNLADNDFLDYRRYDAATRVALRCVRLISAQW